MTLRHATLALLLALPLTGCVRTLADSTAYRTLPPKASAEQVQVFIDSSPDRPFEELGLIEVRKFGLGDSYGPLITRAREEAARMGADAIVVTRRARSVSHTSGSISPDHGRGGATYRSSTGSVEEPRIEVRAVRWKERR